jgi:hypothetical protein
MRQRHGHTRGVEFDWKRLAQTASLRLVPPPAHEVTAGAERHVGSQLSASLTDLYLHTDGLVDEWGYAYVLPLAELIEQNRSFRQAFTDLYMSFDDLILFGQLGNGDMMFQPVVPPRNENVFVWDHEDDSRTWFAKDVADMLVRFATGGGL